jgi:hypothetical protein
MRQPRPSRGHEPGHLSETQHVGAVRRQRQTAQKGKSRLPGIRQPATAALGGARTVAVQPVPSAASRGVRLGAATTLMTAESCDRRFDHVTIGRHAQPVAAASQVAFRRFLRAEMHDPTKVGNQKVALHLRRLEITEPWLPGCSVTFSECCDRCCLVSCEGRGGHHELKDKFAAGRSRRGHSRSVRNVASVVRYCVTPSNDRNTGLPRSTMLSARPSPSVRCSKSIAT